VSGSGSFGQINLLGGGTLAAGPVATAQPTAITAGDFSGQGTITGGGMLTAPINIVTGLVADTGGTDVLTLAGPVNGSGKLTKLGAGTLLLSAANSYLGGTFVESGTLIAANSDALLDGSNITIGNALALSPIVPSKLSVITGAGSNEVAPVPEPATLALAFAALGGVLIYRRRKTDL
jgi:fibronectin-binding autotransporter adhesin